MIRIRHSAAWAGALLAMVVLAGCRTPDAMTGATPLMSTGGLEIEGVPSPHPAAAPAKPAGPAPAPSAPLPKPAQPAPEVRPAHLVPPVPAPAALQPAASSFTGTVSHAAVGCAIQATSTSLKEGGEGAPELMVDGKLATRWSSAYAEPQQINLRFAKPVRIARLRLYWENAAAKRYSVAISPDGKAWTTVHVYMNLSARPVARIDDVNLKGIAAVAMRLDLQERVNPEWGFSLHEIEVVPAP
jgi:hypothetical protein